MMSRTSARTRHMLFQKAPCTAAEPIPVQRGGIQSAKRGCIGAFLMSLSFMWWRTY